MKVQLSVFYLMILFMISGCSQEEGILSSRSEKAPKTALEPERVDTLITNGISETAFKDAFGEPKGSIVKGSTQILLYDDFQVTLEKGVVVDIPESMQQIYADRNEPSAIDKLKEATSKIAAPQEIKAALAKRKAYKLLNAQGEPVNHTALVITGKVTVVEFLNEEVDSCLLVDDELQNLLKSYEYAALQKVDIGSWDSEVSKAYHITTVPDIRMLDRYGNLVSQPITRLEMVDGRVDLARVVDSLEKMK